MRVTETSNPGLYKQLFDARRATLIEAAVLAYNIQLWIFDQEEMCRNESNQLELVKSALASISTPIAITKPFVETREQADRARLEQLKIFKLALDDFKVAIQALNKPGSNDLSRFRYNLWSLFDASAIAGHTELSNKQRNTDAGVRNEMDVAMNRARLFFFSVNFVAGAIVLVGAVLTLMSFAWALLLAAAVALSMVLIAGMLVSILGELDCIETTSPILSDDELQAIYAYGAAGVNVHVEEPSAEGGDWYAAAGSNPFFARGGSENIPPDHIEPIQNRALF